MSAEADTLVVTAAALAVAIEQVGAAWTAHRDALEQLHRANFRAVSAPASSQPAPDHWLPKTSDDRWMAPPPRLRRSDPTGTVLDSARVAREALGALVTAGLGTLFEDAGVVGLGSLERVDDLADRWATRANAGRLDARP